MPASNFVPFSDSDTLAVEKLNHHQAAKLTNTTAQNPQQCPSGTIPARSSSVRAIWREARATCVSGTTMPHVAREEREKKKPTTQYQNDCKAAGDHHKFAGKLA